MSARTIDQAMVLAKQHHHAGRLAEAEAIYRQILAVAPQHADALHFLGLIAQQTGHNDAAVELIAKAVALKRNDPEAYSNLGVALKNQGRLDQAIAACRAAIQLKPDLAAAYYNLGNALKEHGQLDEAIAAFRTAIELRPTHAPTHGNLGIALRDKGDVHQSIDAFRAAIQLKPDDPEAHSNLGSALQELGQLDEAIAAFHAAIQLKPDDAEAHSNLGIALKELGRLDEAIAVFRTAIQLNPNLAEAHSNLGDALKEQGQLDQAIAAFRVAIELKPDFAAAHSNLILTTLYDPAHDAAAIVQETRRWNQQHAQPLAPLIQPHHNDRTPDRRLKVGYVSPDFREHPIGRFLLPLLSAHDHQHFEVFGYSQVRSPDARTQQLRSHTDHWRSIVGLSDERAAELIRQDRIDVLVDLAGHTANNRLQLFARKPAPVQVFYLAYAGTTGVAAIDYRLTDPYLDPPGMNDAYYTEESFRLPQTYWCYRAPGCADIPVAPLPALQEKGGGITFGSLNNFCKVTAPTLATWCRLLHELAGSRLILHAYEGSHRQRTLDAVANAGIDPQRVSFVDRLPLADYYRQYNHIDIALDPFPYAGGTTTCDALWMGVPVVSLCGRTAVARGGLSVLSNLGLPELVAHFDEEYVQIALKLARDLPRLANLRSTLRQRMADSPLMDAPRFARNVEAAYRQMWQKWCARA